MSVTCGFYNSLNHDRKYDATQMSSIFDGIIKDGVFMSIGTHLTVTAGEGMFVTVGEGKAWFNHTWTLNDAELPLAVEVAELVLDRIDAVVLEVDSSEAVRDNSIKIIKGTPSSEPVNPVMENTETLHQYPLAYIYVKANATEITTSDITNVIGTESTPFITGILETVNIDSLIAQWKSQWNDQIDANQREYDAWLLAQQTSFVTWREGEENTFEAWKINSQEEFEAWFENLQNQLDENQAANLQNQINDIKDELKVTGGSRIDVTIDDKRGTYNVVGLSVLLTIDGVEYVAVVGENNIATFFGIVETGVAEIECYDSKQDFSANAMLEIPYYGHYEATTKKIDMYEQWLLTAGYTLDDYPEVSDIVNDYEAMYRMMNLHATVDYWVKWYNTNNNVLTYFTNSEVAMKAIGDNDYAADTLMAIPAVLEGLLGSLYWEQVLNAKVPVMTSSTTPEGEVICSAFNQGYEGYKVFNNTDPAYQWYTSAIIGAYIGYKFVNPICVKSIMIRNRFITQSIGGFVLEASNDNVKWVTIQEYDETNKEVDWQVDTFEVNNDTYYLYWRIRCLTSSGDGSGGIQYLQFYGRKLHALIPPMTSNTTPIGEVSASSEFGSDYVAYNAFDGDNYTMHTSASNESTSDYYLMYDFGKEVFVNTASIKAASSNELYTFKVQASNNKTEWIDVSDDIEISSNDAVNTPDESIILSSTTNYRYYRIILIPDKCSKPHSHLYGGYAFQISELQLHGPDYEETVGLATPGGFGDWLKAGGLNPDSYADMDELLVDEAAVRTLMTKKAAVDVLAKISGDELATIINHRYAAKWINYREYAYSTLSAVPEIKALMDASGMYGMYITAESILQPLVPNLTSNTGSDGGVASGSGVYANGDYDYYYVFDGNSNTCWHSTSSTTNNSDDSYITYTFTKPTNVKRVLVHNDPTNIPDDRYLIGFKVLGSNDGSTWDDLTGVVSYANHEEKYVDIDCENCYLTYKVVAYGNLYTGGSYFAAISTIQFYDEKLWQPKGLVPVMTSNTTPYGEVSCSSVLHNPNVNYQAYYVFDGDETSLLHMDAGVPQWLQYKFLSPTCVRKCSVKTVSPGGIKAKLQASDDGTNWGDLTDVLDFSLVDSVYDININNEKYYLYYRLYIEDAYYIVGNGNKYPVMNSLQFYGRQLESLVPTMTSDTTPVGEVFCSSVYKEKFSAYKAFDGDETEIEQAWIALTTTNDEYIGYKFTKDVCVNFVRFVSITATPNIPKNFKIQASSGDVDDDWIDLYEENGNTSSIKVINLNNDNKYRCYRLLVLSTNSSTDSANIQLLQFYGTPDYDSRTYIYDHGVEVNSDTTNAANGWAITNVIFKEPVYNSDNIELLAEKTSSDNGHVWCGITSKDAVDLSKYNVVVAKVDGLIYINPGYGAIHIIPNKVGSTDSSIASTFVTNKPMTYLDISNIEGNAYVTIFSSDSRSFICNALWLE